MSEAALDIDSFSVERQRARGEARLAVSARDGQSHIERLYQSGCAKIRMPRSGHSNPGHRHLESVMINSSGGLTGGDRLDWCFDVAGAASLTVTSQACERVYKSVSGTAESTVELRIGPHGRLAWLPQETILFDRGNFTRSIRADLDESSEGLFVEPIIFGRRAMGEQVISGALHDSWRIYRGSQLLHGEEFKLSGSIADHIKSTFVTNGCEAMATLLMVSPRSEGYLAQVRGLIDDCDGASAWNGKLLARLIATDGYMLRKKLVPLIRLLNFEASLPKIWTL
ncbi:MAG: urease accessory protein UreD [Rhizobiaceae bacterium]